MSAQDEQTASSPTPKMDAAALELRAQPRRVVRFKRGLFIGVSAAVAVGLMSMAWLALTPRSPRSPSGDVDRHATDNQTPTEALAGLPSDYGQALPPKLGPPLPGDLGRAIVEQNGQAIPNHPSTDQAAQARLAEQEMREAQTRQARQAGVMVHASSRPLAATSGSEASSAIAPSDGPPSQAPNQHRKAAFLEARSSGDVYNSHQLETPRSPFQVMAGDIISASLLTGLNSDLPGIVTAQVTENVYDTVTGRTILIPQGARLIGAYDSVVAFGQKRALLVWQRLILPDGASVRLDNFPAADPAGYAGLEDRVDFHTWRLFKGAAMSTLLGVGTEVSLGGDESDLVRAIRRSAQQSASDVGQQIVAKQLDVQPTLRVRPGWPLRIVVHKDLILRPWRG